MRTQIAIRIAGILAISAAAAPFGAHAAPTQPQVIPDRYMVIFKDSVSNPSLEADKLVRANGGQLHYVYSHALHGFAATLPAKALDAIRRNPNVAYVEQDQVVTADTTQSPATWGIDRIDQRSLPLSGSYSYDYDGAGVYAFIIDTGIRPTHNDFGGRVQYGYDAVGDGNGTNDCAGHGTHVAGTVGGTTYGVAKRVTLVPVRVLNCQGSGTSSGVAAGLDYVTGQTSLRPAVGNMSLGGGVSTTLDTALNNAIKSGVTIAVAAGNSTADACNYSPARVAAAITVGATTSSDAQASYSNYGTCLDLYAPGSSVTSDYYTSDSATATMSGTSMATPHVAGTAALVLSADRTAAPATVAQTILSNATPGKVTSIGAGSPNLLLYSLTGAPPANLPPVATFSSSCTNLSCTFNGSASSDTGGTIASYAWTFGDGGTSSGVT
jgi:subtilisin family serine protease